MEQHSLIQVWKRLFPDPFSDILLALPAGPCQLGPVPTLDPVDPLPLLADIATAGKVATSHLLGLKVNTRSPAIRISKSFTSPQKLGSVIPRQSTMSPNLLSI